MRKSQQGMTFLGLLILLTFVGLFVYAGIRLIPLYLEYMSVAKTLDNLKSEADASSTVQSIRNSLERHFEVDDIKALDWRDIQIQRQGNSWQVEAAYDAQAPFVANISFSVHFDKTVTLGSSAGP
jgi:hypothetical protein